MGSCPASWRIPRARTNSCRYDLVGSICLHGTDAGSSRAASRHATSRLRAATGRLKLEWRFSPREQHGVLLRRCLGRDSLTVLCWQLAASILARCSKHRRSLHSTAQSGSRILALPARSPYFNGQSRLLCFRNCATLHGSAKLVSSSEFLHVAAPPRPLHSSVL